MNYRQIYAIKNENKKRIKAVCPNAEDKSGLYIFTREENGFKYAYVGQSNKVLTRLGEHLSGKQQHIDLSLLKRKLWSVDNLTGWKVGVVYFDESLLNDKEQEFIQEYANNGYQMLNKTSGSQGKGKEQIAEFKPAKGYYDGLEQGKNKLKKELNNIINNYLVISLKKDNVSSQKALEKFNRLLGD